MSATFLVGDVRERMAQLKDGSFDLILCSPPFYCLRSYLPDGHPDKALEIGSEATPAEFLDVLLNLTAEWGRLLAPHGSIAIELGDTYAGSGGAGGDYDPETGLRAGQPAYKGSNARKEHRVTLADGRTIQSSGISNGQSRKGAGWPPDKSLCFLPALYGASLAYGRNLLTGQPSPAGMWRVRNLKPWIRSNPPVGALGDKERPATSYVVVATRARDRYFDLDAVRTVPAPANRRTAKSVDTIPRTGKSADRDGNWASLPEQAVSSGAPPRDWWHHVDAVIDACLDNMAGRKIGRTPGGGRERGNESGVRHEDVGAITIGARGVHIRRALEAAGILTTLDALDVSPTGYSGAHYAVWPKQLVRLLVDEMCPRRVCATCGQPSRRIVELRPGVGGIHQATDGGSSTIGGHPNGHRSQMGERQAKTLGWSSCGHDTWRPGRILDPFVGSGTTLEVATGMDRDAVGVDLDWRNVQLAIDRIGMFLNVVWPDPDWTLIPLPVGSPDPAVYAPWVTDEAARHVIRVLCDMLHVHWPQPPPARRNGRTVPAVAGQLGMTFDDMPLDIDDLTVVA